MLKEQLTVLVLEDNPVQNALYEKILRAGGFEVRSITDPLKLINDLGSLTPPDAIMLDVVMPGMDGVTVMQRLEEDPEWCCVPVLMVTASPTKDRVVAANQLPVPPEGFMAKPVNPKALLQLVRAIIAGQEPQYLLRQLQRKRLSLQLGFRSVLEELGGAVVENRASQATHLKLLVDTRREIQSLQSLLSQLKDGPPETLLALQRQIQHLEQTCEVHRANVQRAEEQHKQMIRRRQDVLHKQKASRDIERRIEALTHVLKRKHGFHPLSEGLFDGVVDEPDLVSPDAELDSVADADPLTGTEG